MGYSNLDRIQVSFEELNKLFAWKDANKDLVRKRKDVLKEGIIDIGNLTSIHFKRTVTGVNFRVFHEKMKVFTFYYNLLNYGVTEIWIDEDYKKMLKLYDPSRQQAMIEDLITSHSTIMAYMEHYHPDVEVKYVSSQNNTKKHFNKGKQKNGKKVINLSSKVYRIKISNNPIPTPKRESYERHTIAWRVRGHWRQYKSGKKVWVNSYTKGNKEEVQGKIYKI